MSNFFRSMLRQANWNKIATDIDYNFLLTYQQLVKLSDAVSRFCGMFASLSDLRSNVSNPQNGNYAYVNNFTYSASSWSSLTSATYDATHTYYNVYTYNNGSWSNTGITDGSVTTGTGTGGGISDFSDLSEWMITFAKVTGCASVSEFETRYKTDANKDNYFMTVGAIIEYLREKSAVALTEYDSRYFRKDQNIETTHNIKAHDIELTGKAKVTGDTQLQDTTFGTFVTGNGGAKIDADGDAEMESLKLRSFLEVPELRFNRASVIAGSTIQSPCGGVIKTVTPTNSYTGIAELELGDDDIAGSIAVGDYCWGYWHDMNNKSNNATADYDNKKGTINYKGFATVYFQVAEILNSNSTRFRYELKEGTSLHPYVGMHFGGRGNSVDKTRQGFTIITPNYQATYQLVSGWNWDAKQHIVRVSGLLDGFEALSDNNEWTSSPCFGTIETNLFLRNSYEELHNQYDSIFITQSSNGMLMIGETETISIVIRNQIFSDQSMENYTFTLNGTAVQAVNREVKFTVSFSDLTQEVTTYKFVATKKTGSGTLTQDIKVRKLMLDYHIETFKAAVNPVNDMMNDFLFDSEDAVQTDDAKAIASVESGSSIYAKRMIGTEEYNALGMFCCKIDDEDEYEYTDGDEIPVQRTNDVFNFTWYTDSTKTKIIHSKEVPVVHDSYDVKVFTRDGTFRIEKGKDNTLIAEVWSGNENITDKLSNYQFSWERISADTGGDTLWNSKHKNVGKTITIADADITRKAVFECVVDL